MARKRRRGGRGFRFGKWVGLAFKVVGAAVALGPAVKSVSEAGSNYGIIPTRFSVNYIGYNPDDHTFDGAKTIGGIGSIVAGLVVAKLGGMLARRV